MALHTHTPMQPPKEISEESVREELKILKIRFAKKADVKSIMEEYKTYITVKRLLPEYMWDNYKLHGVRDLTEIKLMTKAVKALRKAAVKIIKEKKDA